MATRERDSSLALSVVIPTYRKPDTLERVIACLEDQDLPRSSFEVVVIDDGSPDDTPERMSRLIASTPLSLRYLRQANRGVSAARNLGVREARGTIVLLLQDDILATRSLLSRHLDGHRRRPEITATHSGKVTWPPSWEIDHLMRWLDDGGAQFGYNALSGRTTVDAAHFYTCNVSLKRRALLENPFDEEIVYGFEDIELACRLKARGYVFYYDQQALAYHHHRRSFEDFRRRQFAAGQSLYFACRNNPDVRRVIRIPRVSLWKRMKSVSRGLLFPVYRRLGAGRLIERYWRGTLDQEMARGYREAMTRDRSRRTERQPI